MSRIYLHFCTPLILLLVLESSLGLYAQQVDYQIKEVTVTGNIEDFYWEDRNIEIIDSAKLASWRMLTLADALAQQSGNIITSYGSIGSLASMRMHGLSANHTTLSWNGLTLNSISSGETNLALIPAGFMQKMR